MCRLPIRFMINFAFYPINLTVKGVVFKKIK